jgi:basic amino acid/polyamine antiporter, APA family
MSGSGLNRSLGLLDSTMLVAGSMIGSGIFIVSAEMSRDLGSAGWLLVAWLITGIITALAALSYGELAAMMPDAGGQYVYIRRAWGKMTAFLYGWTVFAVIQTGVIAAVAVAFAKFTAVFFPVLAEPMISFSIGDSQRVINYGQLLAVGSIVLLTFINAYGLKNGSLIQRVFTSAKLLALFALIVIGIGKGLSSDAFSLNFSDAWTASSTKDTGNGNWITTALAGTALLVMFAKTMINSLFSADAWNNVTYIAGEIREPHKNIPRSLILGTCIVTLLYLLANVAYLGLLPLHGSPTGSDAWSLGIQFAQNDRVGTAAATQILGNTAVSVMAILIMISTFGCNNGLILAGSRLFYAMAGDNLFFKKAAQLNRASVPAFALWIQCIWAGLLCFTGTYGDLIKFATFASMVFYIVTIAGLFQLRKTEPNTPRPYKALGYPFVPILYILAAIGIVVVLIFTDSQNSLLSIAIIALGIPIYLLRRTAAAKE